MAAPEEKMDYPKLNEKLLDCVLKFLKEHPKNYYQNDWCVVQGSAQDREPYCGTVGCVAGWTCLLTLPEGTDWLKWSRETVNSLRGFSTIAQEKLGLTDIEAGYLFGGTNARGPAAQYKETCKRVAAIKKGRKLGVEPDDVYQSDTN